jgi:SAM-dependent methyltransferase
MVADRLYGIVQSLRPHIPFTALNTVWRSIDAKVRSILDIGCGRGEPMRFIGRRMQLASVGADIFFPYLKECRTKRTHAAVIQCDVRYLPFRSDSFDAVLCMEVLEHMERDEGKHLLEEMERIARLQVILTTPVGYHEQTEYDGNPYQEHKHIWSPAALTRLGYRVVGHGVRGIGGWAGIQSPLPPILRPIVNVAWVMAGPVVRYFPALGGDMVAIKRLRRSNEGGAHQRTPRQ